jgi:hypothetical protein
MFNILFKNILRNISAVLLSFALSFGIFGQSCSYTTQDFPFPRDADFGWSCGLYLPTQIGGAQTMTQISMSLYGPSYMNHSYSDQDIYLRHTNDVQYTGANDDYPGTAGYILVYSGTLDFTSGDGIYTFTFNVNNFNYNGSQTLEVLFINQSGSVYSDGFDFHRTDLAPSGLNIGKYGSGFTWGSATSSASPVQYNLALQFNDVGDVCQYPLPVTLKSSNLDCNENKSTISWETASEKNNDYFTISYSEDGKIWRPVKTIDGAGNSTKSIFYEEVLNIQMSKVPYFRLSQTDFDGTTEILNTFTANCVEKGILKSYPNPADDKVYLSSSENLIEAKVELYDLKGKVYEATFSPSSKNSGEIDINHLASGVYTLRVTTNNVQEIIKVIKR